MPTDPSRLFDMTGALQPTRRAWFQAASLAAAGILPSTALATVILLVHRLGPGLQQKTLAAEAGIDPAALVRLVDQGEELAYLSRAPVEGDRRRRSIALLPAGREIAQRMEDALIALRAELLGDLGAAEIETTTRVLRLLETRALAWSQAERATR